MNQAHLSPDDPRLTAFALGELQGAEREAVEAAVRQDATLQAAVAEIQALAGDLTGALAAEPASEVPDAAPIRLKIDEEAPRRVVRFPYFLISGLAAACFAVMVAVHDSRSPVATKVESVPVPERQVFELALPPLPDAVDTTFVATAAPAEANSLVAAESLAQPLLDQVRAEAKLAVPLASPEPSQFSAFAPPPEVGREAALAEVREIIEQRQLSNAAASAAAAAGRSVASTDGVVTLSAFSVEPASGLRSRLMPSSSPGAGGGLPAGFAPVLATEAYAYNPESGFVRVAEQPVSTFAADVDTASYSNLRRFLQNGQRPPVDAVRVEEMINYFPYRYTPPASGSRDPFAAGIETASAPWNPAHRLVRIGLKGRELAPGQRPPANLVFLLDVSGSMNAANRLPLVLESMRMLVDRLQPNDRVAVVTYAGQSGLALPSTPVSQSREILAALDALEAGGSTHGSRGIQLAYDIARANFISEGLNRVILCTDGDFNVGLTSEGELVRLVEEKARSGVFLTVFGFGMGNLKDATLESLANRGNGVYGYIDSAREARKLLVEQVDGTLATIAKDVKIQVEFNPAKVSSYRLIGYENRALKREDFANDAVDAGEIGAGHTVTALYEVVPVPAAGGPTEPLDPLRYQPPPLSVPRIDPAVLQELLTVKLRFKEPQGTESRQLDFPHKDGETGFADASGDFKFAAAVAGFGLILRDSPHKGAASFDQVLTWAEPGLRDDPAGYRAEFVDLVKKARDLAGR